jgi:iron complex transport system ATP-binding protein
VIEAKDISLSAGAKRLLARVSARGGSGEVVGLIGPNGAGKTTLLKTLAGLLRPESGSVSLQGAILDHLGPAAIARALAMVHQSAPNTLGFTVREIVTMGRYPHMDRFSVEGEHDRTVVLQAMRTTGTNGFEDRPLPSLSGGERQRVMLARALAQEPLVLLLDEPTANLDIRHQLQALDVVRGLAGRGVACIAAMHDLQLAARYCDRLVLLSNGRVLSEGPPEGVLTPGNIETAFGVRAAVYQDSYTGRLAISVLGPAEGGGVERT